MSERHFAERAREDGISEQGRAVFQAWRGVDLFEVKYRNMESKDSWWCGRVLVLSVRSRYLLRVGGFPWFAQRGRHALVKQRLDGERKCGDFTRNLSLGNLGFP